MRLSQAALLSLFVGGCAPLTPPFPFPGSEDRAVRVEALLALRGLNRPDAVEAEAALLDDPDVVVRWTAARSLAARPAIDVQDAVLRRLPGFSKRGIWLGLEVLRRAAADIDPPRLSFLADLKPIPGSGDEVFLAHADERWNTRLRVLATAVLMKSSRIREAFETLAKLAPGPWAGELARTVATSRRPAAVEYVRQACRTPGPFDDFTSRLAVCCLDDPSVSLWTIALGRVEDKILCDGLRLVSSAAVIEEVLASLERREAPDERRRRFLEALIYNGNIPPARLARVLDREDNPAVLEAASGIFYGMEYWNPEPPPPAGRDPSCYLDVRHEGIRQQAAAMILLRRMEPHRQRAERLLRDTPEILLSPDVVGAVNSVEPTLGETLIWRIFRSPKVTKYAIENLAPRVMGSGRRELVDLVLKTEGAKIHQSARTLATLALMPRPEDRPTFKLALEGGPPTCRLFAAMGLVRLGDPEGLQPFLLNLHEAPDLDWPLSFSTLRVDYPKDPRDSTRWALGVLLERFPKEAIAAAVSEAWKKAPSGVLLRLAGELRNPGLKPILMSRLDHEEDGTAAARYLGDLPGVDTMRALHKAFEGKDGQIRRAALESLALLEDPDLIDHLVEALRQRSESFINPDYAKGYAEEVLYNLGTEEAIRALISAGDTESEDGLYRVAKGLAALAPERPETRAAVGRLLQTVGFGTLTPEWLTPCLRTHPGLHRDVLRAARSTRPAIRAQAADFLPLFPHPESEKALARLLEDPEKSVREAAFGSLEKLGSRAGLEKARALLKRGLGEGDSALANYLVSMDPRALLPAALKAATDRDSSIRALGLRSLYWIRLPAAIDGILHYQAHFSERNGGSPYDSILPHPYIEGLKTLHEWEEWWAEHWRSPPFTARPVQHGAEDREEPPFAHVTYQPFKGSRQWRGSVTRDYDGPREFAIQDAAAWKGLWRKSRMPPPPVDFPAHTVLVALLSDTLPPGEWRTSPGPKILGFTREESRTCVYVAHYQTEVKSPVSVYGGGTSWHAVLVPRIKGRIEFVTAQAWSERD